MSAAMTQRPISSRHSEEPMVSKTEEGMLGQKHNQEHASGFLSHFGVEQCEFVPQGQTVDAEHH